MGYKPAPRVDLDQPTHIAASETPRRVWGDDHAGQASDKVYVSNTEVHLVSFTLPPGASFRDSEDYKTYFSADVFYYVVRGSLLLVNPVSTELIKVEHGTGAFVHRRTWHHGFNFESHPLHVLEFIAPPPRLGTTRAYYKNVPLPQDTSYRPDLPSAAEPRGSRPANGDRSFELIEPNEARSTIAGEARTLLAAVMTSTDAMTIGIARLAAGSTSGMLHDEAAKILYVLEGEITLELPETSTSWIARGNDGVYLPCGTPHTLFNFGQSPAAVIFQLGKVQAASLDTEINPT